MKTIATASPLSALDALALNLSKRRAELAKLTAQIDAEQRAVLLKHRADLRAAYGRCAGAQAALQAEITSNPDLFVKPRTVTLHGVKFGFQKGKGRLVIVDEAKTIELAKKHLEPDQVKLLVRVSEEVNKKAAAGLTVAELKKIGMHIEEAVDEVVLTYVDSAVDALLERLLKQAQEDGK